MPESHQTPAPPFLSENFLQLYYFFHFLHKTFSIRTQYEHIFRLYYTCKQQEDNRKLNPLLLLKSHYTILYNIFSFS